MLTTLDCSLCVDPPLLLLLYSLSLSLSPLPLSSSDITLQWLIQHSKSRRSWRWRRSRLTGLLWDLPPWSLPQCSSCFVSSPCSSSCTTILSAPVQGCGLCTALPPPPSTVWTWKVDCGHRLVKTWTLVSVPVSVSVMDWLFTAFQVFSLFVADN